MMENRKGYGTPREWIDNDILQEILGSDEMSGRCGCYGSSEERSTETNCGCGCENAEYDRERSDSRCGCRRNNDSEYDRNRRNNDRSRNSSCGCRRSSNENRISREGRSSCRRDRRSDDWSSGQCGCARERDEYEGHECESCANDDRMSGFPIAMAYVPHQEWRSVYEAEEALRHGTLFNELNLPFNHSACDKDCGCK